MRRRMKVRDESEDEHDQGDECGDGVDDENGGQCRPGRVGEVEVRGILFLQDVRCARVSIVTPLECPLLYGGRWTNKYHSQFQSCCSQQSCSSQRRRSWRLEMSRGGLPE